MTKPEILEKEPMTIVEVKASLNKLKKRDEELGFRAGKTEEYVNQVVKLNQKQANEIKKRIQELEIPRLKNEHIVKVIDTVPGSVAELKVILQGYTLTISNDNLKKIQEIVDDVNKK